VNEKSQEYKSKIFKVFSCSEMN